MIAKLLSVDEITETLATKHHMALKYIKVGGKYRFVLGGVENVAEHKDMLDANELASSGGFCILDGVNRRANAIGESISLQLKPAQGDGESLTALFFQN